MDKDYSKMFVPGALKVPAFPKSTRFLAPARMVPPRKLFNDSYCTAVENQGSKPWCAAYSATSYAESILWRVDGYPQQIDPAQIYYHAKTIDGDPKGDGTTLDAVLEALVAKRYFNPDICKARMFTGARTGGSSDQALVDLKMAIHRYGVCLAGFMIDSSWYEPRRGVVDGSGSEQGGHAVVVCGYDESGVMILNSWGSDWGHEGKVYIPNSVFNREFVYGALLTHALDGLE